MGEEEEIKGRSLKKPQTRQADSVHLPLSLALAPSLFSASTHLNRTEVNSFMTMAPLEARISNLARTSYVQFMTERKLDDLGLDRGLAIYNELPFGFALTRTNPVDSDPRVPIHALAVGQQSSRVAVFTSVDINAGRTAGCICPRDPLDLHMERTPRSCRCCSIIDNLVAIAS